MRPSWTRGTEWHRKDPQAHPRPSDRLQLAKPVPVKMELPPNLRVCADKQDTDPSKFQTRGDLLIGYGDERTLGMET